MTSPSADSAGLTTCDNEPIHIPGSIQPHGVLLALASGTLRIEQVAGDTVTLLGAAPKALLGQPIEAWLGPEAVKHLRETLQAQRSLTRSLPVFGIAPVRGGQRVDAIIHESGEIAVLELEPAVVAESDHTLAALEMMQQRIQSAQSLPELCQGIAEAVRTAIGFDHVMVYRFLPDGSGTVDAEARDPAVEAFQGLRFPASDIPRQARAMYLRNWLRLIPDARYTPAPLLPQLNPTTGQPLDLSASVLRGISPIHLQYLANMGVAASMSISIVRRGELWGLIACHHAAPRRVPPRLRMACELFAEMASLRLETHVTMQELEAKLAARQAMGDMLLKLAVDPDLVNGLAHLRPNMLDLIHAGGVTLWLDGKATSLGDVPSPGEIAALADWLAARREAVFATDRLASLHPPAAAFAQQASGLLALSLSTERPDYLLWFLPELAQAVTWAGDPNKTAAVAFDERLTPRSSFAAWQEVVRRQSRPWQPVEIEAATSLRTNLLDVVLRRFDQVARERTEARRQQDALMAELDHRVKNTLATIQSLVGRSQTGGATLENFLTSFDGRLHAMSRAHGLLTSSRWVGADLRALIAEELTPDLGEAASRVTIAAGAPVVLRPKAALALSLGVHELLTNALRHGALSVPSGRVQIDWRTPQRNGRSLVLRWRETGGPAVTEPPRRGFGLTLIEGNLAYELGGTVQVGFPASGLTCTITVPPDQIAPVATPPPPTASAAQVPGQVSLAGARILVVEDNALIADSLVHVLRASGASVVGPAPRLTAAVDLAETADIDAAILDVDLDGTMVWPAADVLVRRGIPFFFATGYQASLVTPPRFMDHRVLSKPYSVKDLRAALTQLLGSAA